ETGAAPRGDFLPLGEIVQSSRKIVTAWAVEGDLDVANVKSNSFELEWPPKSGRMVSFPEVDRAAWFAPAQARRKSCPARGSSSHGFSPRSIAKWAQLPDNPRLNSPFPR